MLEAVARAAAEEPDALAERVEAWLTGDEPPDPRFALGARVADRALRTAGSGGL